MRPCDPVGQRQPEAEALVAPRQRRLALDEGGDGPLEPARVGAAAVAVVLVVAVALMPRTSVHDGPEELAPA